MGAYIVRDIDPKLWKRFKAKAASEGRGLRYVVLRLIALYCLVGLEALEQCVSQQTLP